MAVGSSDKYKQSKQTNKQTITSRVVDLAWALKKRLGFQVEYKFACIVQRKK